MAAYVGVRGKRVFLSGPMTGIEHYNAEAFMSANVVLKEAGAAYVYNPAIRYVQQRNEVAEAKTHADYMCDCIHELTDRRKRSQGWEEVVPMAYDMLVSLPGWQDSEGAVTERTVAEACGIPVYDLAEVLS